VLSIQFVITAQIMTSNSLVLAASAPTAGAWCSQLWHCSFGKQRLRTLLTEKRGNGKHRSIATNSYSFWRNGLGMGSH